MSEREARREKEAEKEGGREGHRETTHTRARAHTHTHTQRERERRREGGERPVQPAGSAAVHSLWKPSQTPFGESDRSSPPDRSAVPIVMRTLVNAILQSEYIRNI